MDRRVIARPRNPGICVDKKQIPVTGKPENRINAIRNESLGHHLMQIIHNARLRMIRGHFQLRPLASRR